MFRYVIIPHAETRMSQRAVRHEDVELVMNCGTQAAPDAWLMTRAAANREVADRRRLMGRLAHREEILRLKREIGRIERLANKGLKVVVEGGVVITCYPSSTADQRRTLRRGRAGR